MKKRIWISQKTLFYEFSLMFNHWKEKFNFLAGQKRKFHCFSQLTYLFSWFLPVTRC